MKRERKEIFKHTGIFPGVYQTDRLAKIKSFKLTNYQMGIVNREVPDDAVSFFKTLMKETRFDELFGSVRKRFARDDILFILQSLKLSSELQSFTFFMRWINDMVEVCKTFCDILGTDSICFWLGMERSCERYHVDAVDFRMLVTYAGTGTEWLPIGAADIDALDNFRSNDKIVKDRNAIQHVKQWDVSIFRGGPKGVVHRSPDAAMDDGNLSILMRLDLPSFLSVLEEADPENSD